LESLPTVSRPGKVSLKGLVNNGWYKKNACGMQALLRC
jgi:hypothetical protein